MNRLLATTALGLMVIGSGAYAQDTTSTSNADSGFVQSPATGDLYGTDLIGMELYATADNVTSDTQMTEDARSGWDDIGEINDVLLTPDGKVEAVIADIGGFLGMGEHTVAVVMNRIHVMSDKSGTHFATIQADKASLEAAPEFKRADNTAAMAPATGDMAAGSGATTGAAPATSGTMAADNNAAQPADTMAADTNGTMAAAPATDGAMTGNGTYAPPEGYTMAAPEDLTADRLKGAEVYNGDNGIGSISELVLDPDGKISKAVVDVGGFLGIGAHSVALDFDKLHVVNNTQSGDVRVDTGVTKDELKQMPEYEG